jgi:post-segregation antitoxin (ccd killing protein)
MKKRHVMISISQECYNFIKKEKINLSQQVERLISYQIKEKK